MLAALAALALAVAAGCGGDDDDDGAAPQSGERETTSTECPARAARDPRHQRRRGRGRGDRRPRHGAGRGRGRRGHRRRAGDRAERHRRQRPPRARSPRTRPQTASGYEARAVEGFPADTIRVAFDELGLTPDLVVSGINEGQNLGPVVDLSGTVGAARAAVRGRARPGGQPGHRTGPRLRGGCRAGHRLDRGAPRRPACRRGPGRRRRQPERAELRHGRAAGPGRGGVGHHGRSAGAVRLHVHGRGLTDDVTAFANGYAALAEIPVEPAAAGCVIPRRGPVGSAGHFRHPRRKLSAGRRRGPFEIPSSDRPVRHSEESHVVIVRRPRRARAPVRHPGPPRHRPSRSPSRPPRCPTPSPGATSCGKAPTGSGKTLAFGLAIAARAATAGALEPRRPRASCSCPTRELAAQVQRELTALIDERRPRPGRRHLRRRRLRPAAQGAAPRRRHRRRLPRPPRGPHRHRRRASSTTSRSSCSTRPTAWPTWASCPRCAASSTARPTDRQTLLFSATLDGDVDELVRRYQHDPVRHEVAGRRRRRRRGRPPLLDRAPRATGSRVTADIVQPRRLDHRVLPHPARRRPRRPASSASRRQGRRRSTATARRPSATGRCAVQHRPGARPSSPPTSPPAASTSTTSGCVVHFDLPDDAKDYVHRSGRTGRAGAAGMVVALVGEDARKARRARCSGPSAAPSRSSPPTVGSCRPPSRSSGRRRDEARPSRSAPGPIAQRDGHDRHASGGRARQRPRRRQARADRRPVPSGDAAAGDAARRTDGRDGRERPGATATASCRARCRASTRQRGYGFISRRGGGDVFVHVSALDGPRADARAGPAGALRAGAGQARPAGPQRPRRHLIVGLRPGSAAGSSRSGGGTPVTRAPNDVAWCQPPAALSPLSPAAGWGGDDGRRSRSARGEGRHRRPHPRTGPTGTTPWATRWTPCSSATSTCCAPTATSASWCGAATATRSRAGRDMVELVGEDPALSGPANGRMVTATATGTRRSGRVDLRATTRTATWPAARSDRPRARRRSPARGAATRSATGSAPPTSRCSSAASGAPACCTTSPCPIICALKGWTLGTAFERALLCDIRVAGESTRMALPSIDHGLIPDAAGRGQAVRDRRVGAGAGPRAVGPPGRRARGAAPRPRVAGRARRRASTRRRTTWPRHRRAPAAGGAAWCASTCRRWRSPACAARSGASWWARRWCCRRTTSRSSAGPGPRTGSRTTSGADGRSLDASSTGRPSSLTRRAGVGTLRADGVPARQSDVPLEETSEGVDKRRARAAAGGAAIAIVVAVVFMSQNNDKVELNFLDVQRVGAGCGWACWPPWCWGRCSARRAEVLWERRKRRRAERLSSSRTRRPSGSSRTTVRPRRHT